MSNDMNENIKKILVLSIKQDQFELINLFAALDATKFARFYMKTEEFQNSKLNYKYDEKQLNIGLDRTDLYLMQKILLITDTLNEARETLGLIPLPTEIDKLYYEIIDAMKEMDQFEIDDDAIDLNLDGNTGPTYH